MIKKGNRRGNSVKPSQKYLDLYEKFIELVNDDITVKDLSECWYEYKNCHLPLKVFIEKYLRNNSRLIK